MRRPWLVSIALLQVFLLWTLASLGSRWTTRIIVLDEPFVVPGPFRFSRHPTSMLFVRIGAEESALSRLR